MNFNKNNDWKLLYKITFYLIGIMLIFIPIQVIVFAISPPPETVVGFYELFKKNWLLGLISLDLIYILNNMIIITVYLSLFMLLYNKKPVIILLALVFGLIGIACYFPSNPAFEMMTLSTQYFDAPNNLQMMYLSAGEALMASYTGTSFNLYYVINALSLILFSYVIIVTKYPNKTIGIWGLISGILMIIPSSAGTIGLIFSLLSLIPWIVFSLLLMMKLKLYYRE